MLIHVFMWGVNKFWGINSRKIVFISFGGKSYSDNPLAISRKLHEMYPDFKIIWIFNAPRSKMHMVPSYVICVKKHSIRSLFEFATAKFWVDNFTKPNYFFKSSEQVYIQTWHGDKAFKKVLFDSGYRTKKQVILEQRHCDLMISGSDYGTMQFRSAFRYNGDILQKGMPRNDVLLNKDVDKVRHIRKLIGVDECCNILLFAPTFRDSNQENRIEIGIDLLKIIEVLEGKYQKEWVCLIRAHSAVIGGFITDGLLPNKILDVTRYEDMSDLLLIADMLITDYSSCAGDFALTGNPIILYQPDRQEYIRENRCLYFDMEVSPYWVAMNQSDILSIVMSCSQQSARENSQAILDFYGSCESGEASKSVVEYIVEKSK